ncbi:MAG: metallophosphoesterase [Lentisphaerae bacterium]|nr:metallophosphoesterase [Lentisphaerota bacterium]MCP4099813.1 metallophosphoesterase [Lentisphaerota bacterium]
MLKFLFVKAAVVTIIFLLPTISSAKLRIGVIGDQTGTYNLEESYSIMKYGCEVISSYEPEILLHVGDIVESSKSDDQIKVDFGKATAFLNNIFVKGKPVKWFLSAGDHDVNPKNDYTAGTKNYMKRDLF